MFVTRRGLLLAFGALAACAPLSPEAVERLCADRARAATGPSGAVGLGVGSRGVSGGISLNVSQDYLAGRPPQEVYDRCVQSAAPTGGNMR